MAEVTSGVVFLGVISSGLAAALATQGMIWFKEFRKEGKLEARQSCHTALLCAVVFEQFAHVCSNAIAKNEYNYDSQGDNNGGTVKLPMWGELPGETDLRSIDPQLTARALTLKTKHMMAVNMIEATSIIGEDAVETFNEEAAKLGLAAWEIANAMRQGYGFDPFPTDTHDKFWIYLKEHAEKNTPMKERRWDWFKDWWKAKKS